MIIFVVDLVVKRDYCCLYMLEIGWEIIIIGGWYFVVELLLLEDLCFVVNFVYLGFDMVLEKDFVFGGIECDEKLSVVEMMEELIDESEKWWLCVDFVLLIGLNVSGKSCYLR